MLFAYLTLEKNTALNQYIPAMRPGGVSLLWGVFAFALVLGGIRNHVRSLRYLGLALFTVVALKLFFRDLAELGEQYRIVAFIFMGGVILCGSFVYLKYRDTFALTSAKREGVGT